MGRIVAYYGRENINKEKFLCEHIEKNSILIAPDQFTLEMERLLLSEKKQDAIFDIEVLSFNRLGDKILKEVGGDRKVKIDKYGRHMLLTKIAIDNASKLGVYEGQGRKVQFIDMVNNFISELKQAGIDPDKLSEYIANLEKDSYTAKKLIALKDIYSLYNEELDKMKGVDSESKIDDYLNKLSLSNDIKGKTIWIYGFDSLAPKEVKFINALSSYCDINIILTYDDSKDEEIFDLSGLIIDKLSNLYNDETNQKVEFELKKIDDKYILEKKEGIKNLEENLFKFADFNGLPADGVRVIEASNLSNEAENVAMLVLDMIKNKGYRMRDIRIICNDTENRVPLLKRMFEEYGLEVFSDENVSIVDTDLVQYVLTSLEVIENKYSTDLIMKLLKSGFSDLTDEEIIDLENYTHIYKVKGTMWKKDFTLGKKNYGTEYDSEIERINILRKKVVSNLERLEEILKEKTIASFVDKYIEYLHETIFIDQKVEELIKTQEDVDRKDLSSKTAQVIDKVENILYQIKDVLADVEFNLKDFIDIFRVGLSSVKVGLLPPTVDGLVLGTSIRSRFIPKKAVIFYGANEGILPKGKHDNVILSNDERKKFNKKIEEEDSLLELKGLNLKSNKISRLEENMGIYRNLSRAKEDLIFTYSLGDLSGEKINPAEVVKKITQILDIKIEKDLVESNSPLLLNNTYSGKRHLIEKIKKNELDSNWENYISYLKVHDPSFISKTLEKINDKNEAKSIGEEKASALYFNNDEINVSPSKIENYTRCPFRYFIDYGIKPKEKRIFEVDARNKGEIYHEIFEKILKGLVDVKGNLKGKSRPCEKKDIISFVKDIFNDSKFKEKYPELENMEGSPYFRDRIIETAIESSWVLVRHLTKGDIKESRFEEEFGKGKALSPIEFTLKNGKKGYISGKIDRYDILSDGSIKIIDYKTGLDELKKDELEAGYRLQLFIYYEASKEERPLAGLFYYHIWEPKPDDNKKEVVDLDEEISKTYKMSGLYINNLDRLKLLDADTSIAPLVSSYKLTKSGELAKTSESSSYTEEEFKEIENKINNIILNNFNDLVEGKIDIEPMKTKSSSNCKFCKYKGICLFDEKIFNNSFNNSVIKKDKEIKKRGDSLTE